MLSSTRLCLFLLAGALLASPAMAQDISSIPGAGRMATGQSHRAPEAGKPAEPSALPGARSSRSVAPLTKPPSEMGPTEALFDAVNRGDIAAVRDLLTRGADLGGRNALGLTPLELAVDLGQNDIAFLLLSLRDADTNRGTGRDTGKVTPAKAVAPVRQPSPLRMPAPRPPPMPNASPRNGIPVGWRHACPERRLPGLRRRALTYFVGWLTTQSEARYRSTVRFSAIQ